MGQLHSIQTASAPEPFWEGHRPLPTASQRSLKREAELRHTPNKCPPSLFLLPATPPHDTRSTTTSSWTSTRGALPASNPPVRLSSLLTASASLAPTAASGTSATAPPAASALPSINAPPPPAIAPHTTALPAAHTTSTTPPMWLFATAPPAVPTQTTSTRPPSTAPPTARPPRTPSRHTSTPSTVSSLYPVSHPVT
ncbi:hypothetical protein B0H14DRAFT_3575898, partial [Mycena olivaceomarginata]